LPAASITDFTIIISSIFYLDLNRYILLYTIFFYKTI
jgi:hypothetical protein